MKPLALAPDGHWVAGSAPQLTPGGEWIGNLGEPQLAPDGKWVAGAPQLSPDSRWIGSGAGSPQLAPDGH